MMPSRSNLIYESLHLSSFRLQQSGMSLDSISLVTGETLRDVQDVEYQRQAGKAWITPIKGNSHQDPLSIQERLYKSILSPRPSPIPADLGQGLLASRG
jgi:hypothetical protein